jgi:hypothetical protein
VRSAIVAISIAVGVAGASAAATGSGAKSAGCGIQSGASFPHLFTDPHSLVVGPFAFSDLHDAANASPDNITYHDGWKSPAVLRIKHRAVVTIDKDSRSNARLDYTHSDAAFRRLPHTMRYVACTRASEALSDADGKPVTFWSGFFVVKNPPACVGFRVKVDGRRARHFKVAIGRGGCSP